MTITFDFPCSLYRGKHRMVYVGERGNLNLYRCACTREGLGLDCDARETDTYAIIEPEEEAALLEAIPDAQERVLGQQLQASLRANQERAAVATLVEKYGEHYPDHVGPEVWAEAMAESAPRRPADAVCEHGTTDPDNPHDPCMECAL